MTTASAPFYWLVCDRCGKKSTEGSEYAAWADADQANDDAVDADWTVGEQDYCLDCSLTEATT